MGEADIGGIMSIPEMSKGMPPSWGAYVTVDDVDATAAKAEKLGGKIIVAPTDIPTVVKFCRLVQRPGLERDHAGLERGQRGSARVYSNALVEENRNDRTKAR